MKGLTDAIPTTDSVPLLRVEHLVKHFPVPGGFLFSRQREVIQAVNDVSFELHQGETLGLVGETGCGKSTVARCVVQLYRPTAGHIYFHGVDLTTARGTEMRAVRRHIQIIFQDPYASLNPRYSVRRIVQESLDIHRIGTPRERRERVAELLAVVGLNPDMADRYPHEFSGGQRQRISIARALALNPSLIICDEPVSALDVSIQAQILNLLEDLQREQGFSYLFIAHDLAVVKHISHRVAVMYLGRIVELASSHDLYRSPLQPYTQALMAAIPVADPARERAKRAQRSGLRGELPSPRKPPPGCHFHPRCPHMTERCTIEVPQLREVEPNHWVACHLYE
ncbi:MAG TPA: dipeptide ABC transporter ATP-binding protein [Anaerolineae bacterium]|nr:dipeptide ABC transporter ATP-binding protein [Anaerolineae bacterium]HIQ05922.1 dipeptide ABC transporter ATP-binding protein [Anaerolineae bacterium]